MKKKEMNIYKHSGGHSDIFVRDSNDEPSLFPQITSRRKGLLGKLDIGATGGMASDCRRIPDKRWPHIQRRGDADGLEAVVEGSLGDDTPRFKGGLL